MSILQTICLLNDSFPPVIDGVANAVLNYGENLHALGDDPIVVTPEYPGADDGGYPFPVLRYPALDLRSMTAGYMAGVPFAPEVMRQLTEHKPALLHSHCPVVSTMLGREFRQVLDVPLVMTYHTKFDVDIANLIHSKVLQESSKRALVENINACDEVWAVSRGAAENLRSLGYEGECVIMQNGVDLPRGRVSEALVQEVTSGLDLPGNVPVFLFVGRIMWYKGLRIILDAMAALKAGGKDFRMVFVGGGGDFEAVKSYSESLNLQDKCFFPGPEADREKLRAWYCRANLFLFPSTFDTNGLVVREAAACGLGAVLIGGSCAAEGVTDGRNGLLIEENAESMAACLQKLDTPAMTVIGQHAQQELYISWETAVDIARARYEVVIDRYRSGGYPTHHHGLDSVFKVNGELMEGLCRLEERRDALHKKFTDKVHEMKHIL